MSDPTDSLSAAYAQRLARSPLWKRLLPLQAPYRYNLRRLRPGYLLDVGCGVGRNLHHLDGRGVGIDPNPTCVAEARRAGLVVFTPEEYFASERARSERFDTLLFSHVLEHMRLPEAVALVRRVLPWLRGAGRVVMIAPQRRGFASDPTHVEHLDEPKLREIAAAAGLTVEALFSFPLPRWAGGWFTYNESVLVAHLDGGEKRSAPP